MFIRAHVIRRGVCNDSAVRYHRGRGLDLDANEKSEGEQKYKQAGTLAEDELHKSITRDNNFCSSGPLCR